ncbi:MAG: hypothetical protein OXQ30_11860 [Boseongicola sp.]|nr:hypothetical protein [Boseongicola sp.]
MSRHTQGSLTIVAAIAAGIFLVALVALMVLGDYSFSPAAFLSLLIALLAAIVLYLGFGGKLEMPSGAQTGATSQPATSSSAATADADAAARKAAEEEAAAKAAAEAEAARKAAEDKAAADAAAAKAAADEAAAKAAADEAAAKRAADEAAAKRAADDAAAASAAAASASSAAPAAAAGMGEDYDGDGVLEGTNEGTRPAGLDAPRGGQADDLKQIKGVGLKMEQLCNSLGFWHFDQVASWTPDEVAWVDANLQGFKGRVTRDGWVEQAKILAAGGETEFSKRVEGGDVY